MTRQPLPQPLRPSRLWLALGVAAVTFPGRALPSTWSDPSWEEMLRDSDLIALCEVVRPGLLHAEVSPVSVFKGSVPGDLDRFWVVGFNDEHLPPEGREGGAFLMGQTYFLFLREGHFERRDELEDWWERSEKYVSEYVVDPQALASLREALGERGKVYDVWTPSAGVLQLSDGRVGIDLSRTSFARFSAFIRERAEVEEILKRSIAFQDHGRVAPAFLPR